MAQPVIERVAAAVQTTDATETTLLTFTLPVDSIADYTAHILAYEPATEDAAYYTLRGGWMREGGGTAAVPGGSPLVRSSDDTEDQADWDGTADLNGGDFRLRVTGEAAKTIEWSAHLEIVYQTP